MSPDIVIIDDPPPAARTTNTSEAILRWIPRGGWRLRWWLWRHGYRRRSYINSAGSRTIIMVPRR